MAQNVAQVVDLAERRTLRIGGSEAAAACSVDPFRSRDDYARNLDLVLCPRCNGALTLVGWCCALCEGTGLLDQNGDAFYPPPPFDRWQPAKLAALARAAKERKR